MRFVVCTLTHLSKLIREMKFIEMIDIASLMYANVQTMQLANSIVSRLTL